MPAAMMHGGGGVLLMMTKKLETQQTIEKTQNCKTKCNESHLPYNHIQLKTTTQNEKQKSTTASNTLLN